MGFSVSIGKVVIESTAFLMNEFYQRMRGGASVSEALRQAKRTLMRAASETNGDEDRKSSVDKTHASASHPFYWAPFQLYGDWR